MQQRQQLQPSFRSGGMFGATNNNYDRRSSYNYGSEENGRPQFSRTGAAGSATASRSAGQQRNGGNGTAAGSAGAGSSSYTSRPTNLYRVSDVQRYGQGSAAASHSAVSVGAIVQHDRFGVGEVQATEGLGDNAKATIKFQNAGVKTLLLKFAKLKIIG
jgi:hypothetical protein